MNVMKNKKALVISLIIIIIAAVGGIYLFNRPSQPTTPGDTVYVEVDNGDSVDTVIEKVIQAGVNVDYDKLYDEFVKKDAKIYPNQYQLTTNMSASEIVDILNNPMTNIEGNKLIIVEGDNLVNVASNLAQKSDGRYTQEQIINYWNDQTNLNNYINQYWFLTEDILQPGILYPLEGYFAPATYNLLPNFELEDMTKEFLDAMGAELEPYREASNRHNLSIQQFITLASIVERESMHEVDRPKIAGVFYNRLEQNMPLQSDITVLYAKQEHKELVTIDDTQVDSPYNTYKNLGIPIGPIAMVQASCLEAVSNPEENDYLYFFAKQDTGEVIYSRTLEEHQKVSEENAWQ